MTLHPESYNYKANRLRMALNEAAPLLMWKVLMFDEYVARRGQDVVSDLFYVRCELWANGELFSTDMKVDPWMMEQCRVDMPERIAARAAVKFSHAILQWRK